MQKNAVKVESLGRKYSQRKNLSYKPDVVSFGGKFSVYGKKHPLRFSNNGYMACSAEKSIENVVGRFRDKIKIIFSDIDGTISPHDDEVSKEVVDIFEKLHLQNIPTIHKNSVINLTTEKK